MITVWLSEALVEQMYTEADRVTPLETGGILMGYWAAPPDEAIITDVIGPGPSATHARSRFVPDARYQEAEVARVYQNSGRLHTYLGDWHTHPDTTAYLSRTDRRTLRKIARSPEARVRAPIMAVLAGGNPWELRAWYSDPTGIVGSIWPTIRKASFTRYSK